MTGAENTSEKNNGNEEVPPDDEHLPLNDKGLVYKTEITIAVNGSDDISDGNDEDFVILRNDNNTVINRPAYSKLHKVSTSRLSTFSLGRFELFSNNQKKSTSSIVGKKESKPRTKEKVKYNEQNNNSEDIEDFIPCVIRKSESVDTVDRIEKELSNFIMDNKKKDKKRTNSFRKLFSVFGKDKKKKVKETDVTNTPNSDYVDNYQNETNSNSFIRNTPQRHTVSCDQYKKEKSYDSKPFPPKNIEEDPPPEILRKYANNHINKFNKIRKSFEHPDDNESNIKNEMSTKRSDPSTQHSQVIKYIDTSSSTTSTMESAKFNTYQNALIAQAEFQQLKKENNAVDTRPNLIRNDSFRRDTPPRATDTHQPVNIVKPRARLPINSERALPNPYHNEVEDQKDLSTTYTQENEGIARPEVLDIYGTVFDAIDQSKRNSYRTSTIASQDSRKTQSPVPITPRSPSLEGSKLRLPSNRDITPLQPRLRSPLPTARVSTEKIIATELLKNTNSLDKKSPSTPNSLTRPNKEEKPFKPQAESTPDMKTCQALNALREKFEENSQKLNEELDQIKQTLQNISHEDSPERIPSRNGRMAKDTISNPTSSPRGTMLTSPRSSMTISPVPLTKPLEVNCSSPTPGMYPQGSSDVELRQKHSVVRRNGSQSNVNRSPSSPIKDEMRKSVEAYYWKEIKRIKEQEDYEIYLSQLHFSQRGYAEDPILSRRSRGMDENRGRRSSSVPRNPKQHQQFDSQQNIHMLKTAIPEGNAVAYRTQDRNIYGYLPSRTSQMHSSRSSITNTQRQANGDYATYKPIFRRGSLSGGGHAPQTLQINKKVSFSNSQQPANVEAWPTRNGFTRSPPQRRLDKMSTNAQLEDDVFLPPTDKQVNMQQQQIYGQNQVLRNHYNSETESIYGQNPYGYAGQPHLVRPANYNSDSEAVYGGRYYRTMSRQEMENLRNAQANSIRQPDLRSRPVPRLTRHESIQLPESPYGYSVQYGASRQYQTNGVVRDNRMPVGPSRIPPRREILITDNIYGQHIGYRNEFASSPYGYTVNNNPNIPEPVYAARPKQVTVRNKVCDMYGRIHDVAPLSGNVQASGVLMGQIQDLPTSPPSFRRGTRLTASNNDMLYRRQNQLYENRSIEQNEILHGSRGSVRPLPPLPPSGKAVNNDHKNANTKKNNSSKKKKK